MSILISELNRRSLINAIETKQNDRPALKKLLFENCNKLDSYFKKHHQDVDFSIHPLNQCRSEIIDCFIKILWQQHLSNRIKICLIGVGGYGRSQLLPHSDIDILILYNEKITPNTQERISNFLTSLWDIGLKVGHSTRNLSEVLNIAKQDVTVYTNLLEMRYLNGDESIFDTLKKKIKIANIISKKTFFSKKIIERSLRHQRFDGTAHILEPDIKNSPGGLRDIQLLKWFCIKTYNSDAFDILVQKKILNPQDLIILKHSEAYLLKLRYALHLLNERDDNRLFFDKQTALSLQFDFKDCDHQLAIESFMKQYYIHIKEIRALSDIILQFFDEYFFKEDYQQIKKINKDFQLRNSYLDFTETHGVIEKKPALILSTFKLLSQKKNIKGLTFNTMYQIRENIDYIDNRYRMDLNHKKLFLDVFIGGKQIHHALQLMNRHSVLGRYYPVFDHIVGQTQHDLFHIYTVDQHTIFLLKKINELTEKDEHYKNIFKQLAKPELLYLAGFFHDIGKGRRTDHSKFGSKAILEFTKGSSFNKSDVKLMSWLVKCHLLLSETAQKKDLSDEEVISKFCYKIKNQQRLNYLYLLTIADIQATNPSLWNSWRSALLKQLYLAASIFLKHNKKLASKAEQIEKKTRIVLPQLLDENYSKTMLRHLWDKFGPKYLLKESVEHILWHTKILFDFSFANNACLVDIVNHAQHGATEIFVCAKDRDNLFSNIVLVLDKCNLNILDARILTSSHGFSLNTFSVLDANLKLVSKAAEFKRIKNSLTNMLKDSEKIPKFTKRRIPRILTHFCNQSEITFQNIPNRPWTKLNISAPDRPGLLAKIGLAFKKCEIRVHHAKVITMGDQIEDIFFISDQDNRPLISRKRQIQLRKQIKQEIEL